MVEQTIFQCSEVLKLILSGGGLDSGNFSGLSGVRQRLVDLDVQEGCVGDLQLHKVHASGHNLLAEPEARVTHPGSHTQRSAGSSSTALTVRT